MLVTGFIFINLAKDLGYTHPLFNSFDYNFSLKFLDFNILFSFSNFSILFILIFIFP